MYWNKFFHIFLIVFVSQFVFANSGEKTEEPTKEYSGKQTQEWQTIQAKVQAAKGKLEQQEVIVKGLLEAKRATGGHGNTATHQSVSDQEQVGVLKKEHQKLLSLIKEYNELRDQLETRFPEKSAKEGRIYKRINPASLEAIENDMSFEGRLRRIDRKIREKYPKSVITKEKSNESEHKQHIEKNKKVEPPKNVTEPIILQK